ncbi:amino acid synthesis family protein [Pacificimonas sp. ICDLI1SI03]
MIEVRKTIVCIEEIRHERGPVPTRPLQVAVACAVVRNPFANTFEQDLIPFQSALRELGWDLSDRLTKSLDVSSIEAFGKGAIVGEDGELEHGAVWHEAGGWALREALGGAKAIVPAAKTIGTLGTRLMIPLGHVHAAYVRSHFGTAEMSVWDGPRRDEILFGLAASDGGRIHARSGGLSVSEITAEDGLR